MASKDMIYSLSPETVAFITGASSGIGRAAAMALATRKVRLSLLARSGDQLNQAASETKKHGGGEVITLSCDVRNEGEVERAVAATLDRFGRIDILINSAGLSLNGEVENYQFQDWRTVIDTNLTGTFLTCRGVLPTMKRQGSGQIINISSGAGRNGIKQMAAYCASKFGVIGFTESLALEVRNQNIRVSVLLPGSVATNFSSTARRENRREAGEKEIGYALTPDEVAAVIVSMLEQADQAWMSEVVLRPLNLESKRSFDL